MVKVILTHLGSFDLKPFLIDPLHKSSNWFCHCWRQPPCKYSESKLKLFQAARVADSQQSWKHFLILMISMNDLLLMGCTPTSINYGGGGELGSASYWNRSTSLFDFRKSMKFVSYRIVKSSIMLLWLDFFFVKQWPYSTAAKHCHSSNTKGRNVIKGSDHETETQG